MSYQSDLQADLIIARHEAGHALHAHLCGHIVQRVVLGSADCFCDIQSPVTPSSLKEQWANSPLLASLELCRAIGTLRAGALCELAYRDVAGRDAAALAVWQQAYTSGVGSNSDWTRLYAHVFERLTAWHRHQSIRSAISAIAEMLLRQRSASRQAWLTMVEIGLVELLCPEPVYTPLLPSPPPPRSSQASARSFTPSAALRVAPLARASGATADAEESLWDDRQHRYYSVDERGRFTLFRRECKASGANDFLLTERVGEDVEGRPVMRGSRFGKESEGRKALARLAG